MSRGSSESRRRRLLQRGLIGDALSADWSGRADAAPDSTPEFQTESAVTPTELATRSQLGETESTVRDVKQVSLPAVPVSGSERQIKAARRITPASQGSRTDAGLATIKTLLAGEQPLTWVFTGDNIVQGAFYTHGRRTCVEIFTERIRAELRRSMDMVVNSGISGDTVDYLMTTLQWRIKRFHPDVVVASLGLNDCKAGPSGIKTFEARLQDFIDEVRTNGAIPLLILPHPVCSASMTNRAALPDYVEAVRKVALRDEVPCVDHWTFWQQHWPTATATRQRLHLGRMHLNSDAHAQLAGLIFETLGIFDPQSAICQLTKLAR